MEFEAASGGLGDVDGPDEMFGLIDPDDQRVDRVTDLEGDVVVHHHTQEFAALAERKIAVEVMSLIGTMCTSPAK